MELREIIITVLSATGIIGTLIGFGFSRLGKKLDQQNEERKQREAEHWEYERVALNSIIATNDLGITVAEHAIKNGCNSNSHSQLKSSRAAGKELKELIQKRATKNV